MVEASLDKAPSKAQSKAESLQEALVQSSIFKAPSAVPSTNSASAKEAAVQSSITMAPSEVPAIGDKSHTNPFGQSSIAQEPGQGPKLTFVVEPQLNKAAPGVGFAETAKPVIRQADVEISEPQAVAHHGRKTGRVLAVKPSGAVTSKQVGAAASKPANSGPSKGSSSSDSTATVDVSQAKNGNQTYVQLMSRTMESLLAEMKGECTKNGANFAVIFIPSRAQMSPTPGMETNFFNITYADEIRLVTKGCSAEHIPCFDGERAAERVAPVMRPDLFYLMHMNAIGHKLFAGQIEPFIAQLIGKTNK